MVNSNPALFKPSSDTSCTVFLDRPRLVLRKHRNVSAAKERRFTDLHTNSQNPLIFMYLFISAHRIDLINKKIPSKHQSEGT